MGTTPVDYMLFVQLPAHVLRTADSLRAEAGGVVVLIIDVAARTANQELGKGFEAREIDPGLRGSSHMC